MNFQIALQCTSPDWWRYNVFLTLVGYDAAGEQVDYAARTEHVFDVWGEQGRVAPADWMRGAELGVECRGERATAWVYAIPNTLPAERSVAASPDFEVVVVARRDGTELFRKRYRVNPWGGLSIVELKIEN